MARPSQLRVPWWGTAILGAFGLVIGFAWGQTFSLERPPNWTAIVGIVGVGSTLAAVVIGAELTAESQREERRRERFRQQLDEFYGPLLSMRQYIEARSTLRKEISERGHDWWQGLFEGVIDPENKRRITERHRGEVDSRIEYDNRELRELLLPKYWEMLAHFGSHLSLAEPATRAHYPALVQFIALWDRFLEDGVPRDVVADMQSDGIAQEETLRPLYADLQTQVERLSSELRTGGSGDGR